MEKPAVLSKIPLVQWVRGTIEKMSAIGATDVRAWNQAWIETYLDLDGEKVSVGRKGCPRAAAYGLWRLGRIKNGGVKFQDWPLKRVHDELGKNATYAVLAVDLLKRGVAEEQLWDRIQKEYRRRFDDPPADSEQGEMRVALILYDEQQIVES